MWEARRHALERRPRGAENALALLCGVAPSELVLATSDAALTVPGACHGAAVRPAAAPPRRRVGGHADARGLCPHRRRRSGAYPRLSLTGTLGLVSADLAR